MTILNSSAKAAARWNGALAARLRHAPLETFMRSQDQKWVLSGESRVTDNLACATLYFMQAAVNSCPAGECFALGGRQTELGQLICTVSQGIATLIREPTSWRIAALVATARVLAPHIGIDAAAHAAAAAARAHSKCLGAAVDTALSQVNTLVIGAVESNHPAVFKRAVMLIAGRVAPPAARLPACAPMATVTV